LTLPPLGNALNITLGDKTSLSMKDGFFSGKNRINSVVVQGKSEDFKNTQNHVVLLKNSLRDIWGNFPEISFKNLKSVQLAELSLSTLLELNLIVEDVWHVVVEKRVFGSTTVNASFNDIADLELREGILSTDSYNLTKPKIFINRSWITTLHPMRGKKLTELRIENSGIESIKPSAFKIIELLSLVLDNVTIHTIESDIFSEAVSHDRVI
jgi:Leucine-rich repeat (LRR) protein